MAIEKTVNFGPLSVTVAEAAGVVSAKFAVAGALGGGKASGVAKGSLGGEIDLDARQSADLAIALLEAHFPSATSLLEMVKAGVDAELAKV